MDMATFIPDFRLAIDGQPIERALRSSITGIRCVLE